MRSNVEILEAINEAYSIGDYDAAFSLVDPEIEWIEPRNTPDAEVTHGHEGVRHSLTKFIGTWTDYRFDSREVIENGDRVMVHVHISGKGKASGAPVEMDQFQVWTFRDGKAVRMEMFTNESEGRMAAGLEPVREES